MQLTCASTLLAIALIGPHSAPQAARELSLEERVAAQRVIEQVYWNHRIWPDASRPKPGLAEVLPDAAIRDKVEDYLRKSRALEARQGRPITPEQLQAEVERMVRETRARDVLRGLFAALGNDPFVIAETLARRSLADGMLLDPGTLPEASPVGGSSDSWRVMQSTTPRDAHSTIWTGAEMIVWGGVVDHHSTNTGARYDPATDRWAPTPLVGPFGGKVEHTAVWTGSEMIVWGGINGNVPWRYNPMTNTWSFGSNVGAPSNRAYPSAVWTGSEMIVWGGDPEASLNETTNTGGRYDPSLNRWLPTSTVGAPAARYAHAATWTGSEMIVWGGWDYGSPTSFTSGARYNPSTDTWVPITTVGAPPGANWSTSVWTGSEMIVWGGHIDYPQDDREYLNSGGRYDPAADAWVATATSGAPSPRAYASAVWTGSEMIVWGGGGMDYSFFGTGARYNPVSNGWMATSEGPGVPSARTGHSAVWTGVEMIVWGGFDGNDYRGDGGLYAPHCPGVSSCIDDDPCTEDSCDPLQGCVHVPMICDNANGCANSCVDGICVPTLPDDDNDGICEGVDNCPAELNPDQTNADGDSYGDVCDPCPLDSLNDDDTDSVCGSEDNCLANYNPDQADADGEGHGDACDCAPTDPAAFAAPSEVQNLRWLTRDRLAWDSVVPESGALSRHDVVRGDLASVSFLETGAQDVCLAEALDSTQIQDFSPDPAPGSCYFYLVRGRNACGPGPFGTTSAGQDRITTACGGL